MRIIITSIILFLFSTSVYSQFVDISDPNISVSSEITFMDISSSAIYKGIHYSLKTLKNGDPVIEFILLTKNKKKISTITPNIILELSPTKLITLAPYRDSSYYFPDGSLIMISLQTINRADVTELKSGQILNLVLFGNQKEKIKLTKWGKRDIQRAILSFFRNYS